MPTIRNLPSGDQLTVRAVQSIMAFRRSRRAKTDHTRMDLSSPTVAKTSGFVGCVASPHSSPSKCDSWIRDMLPDLADISYISPPAVVTRMRLMKSLPADMNASSDRTAPTTGGTSASLSITLRTCSNCRVQIFMMPSFAPVTTPVSPAQMQVTPSSCARIIRSSFLPLHTYRCPFVDPLTNLLPTAAPHNSVPILTFLS
mmetsp:Transcript_11059/g.24531  ORF Transcript_11059/g.24531 Transcript_11059/m.24531 type:complete len:200 (-) Transcript_11059:5507-6106(-)